MLFRRGATWRADRMAAALDSLNQVMRDVGQACRVPVSDLAATMPKTLEYF